MTSTGPSALIQLFHNERVIRDAPSGASWADEYGLVTTDGAGAGIFETDMKRPFLVFISLHGSAAGTTVPAADLTAVTQDAVTGRYHIPITGDASATYAVRLVGKFEGS